MSRYMVVTPHSPKECTKMLHFIEAQGYLHHFDWGCKDGEHCGWAIIETNSREEAWAVVPPLIRAKAKVVGLNKFTDEEVNGLH